MVWPKVWAVPFERKADVLIAAMGMAILTVPYGRGVLCARCWPNQRSGEGSNPGMGNSGICRIFLPGKGKVLVSALFFYLERVRFWFQSAFCISR